MLSGALLLASCGSADFTSAGFLFKEGGNVEIFLMDQKGSFSLNVELKSPGFLTMKKEKN